MSYIVHQKVKGKVYAYEAESYWDSEKKSPRQRRRYLGVVDEETGQIIEKKFQRDIKAAKDYGPTYLLDRIAGELKLRKKLADAFGQQGEEILALAMAKVIKPDSLRNLHRVLEDSFLPELYSLEGEYTSQRMSRLIEDLGSKEGGMASFYASLVRPKEEALVYDITSLSSYSRNLDWLEYGYNRDGMDLPQVNLGLVVSLESRLPLLLKLFPGSVTDVVTLRNLAEEARALGIVDCMFILDRGFYSEGNIELLQKAGIDFIMPLPFGRKVGKGLISETNAHISDAENARTLKDDIYHVVEEDLEIAGVKLKGFVFFSKKKEFEEHQSFYRHLLDTEQVLEGAKFMRGNPMQHFQDAARGYANYFECTVQDQVLHLKRRQNAIAQAENRFGKMILLSSRAEAEWDSVLSLYRQREEVEDQFDQLKNELDLLPLRIQKTVSLRGLLFIFFVALLLRVQLLNRAREAGLLARQSVDDILAELGRVRAVSTGGRWMLTEVPKKARVALQKLRIPVPVGVST
jgi:transposase